MTYKQVTSSFGSLKMKCSKYKRAAEESDTLTFTTNLSPLCLHREHRENCNDLTKAGTEVSKS